MTIYSIKYAIFIVNISLNLPIRAQRPKRRTRCFDSAQNEFPPKKYFSRLFAVRDSVLYVFQETYFLRKYINNVIERTHNLAASAIIIIVYDVYSMYLFILTLVLSNDIRNTGKFECLARGDAI